MRDDHWDELIDEYYASLKNTIPEVSIPSFERLNREFHERALHPYYIASFFFGNAGSPR